MRPSRLLPISLGAVRALLLPVWITNTARAQAPVVVPVSRGLAMGARLECPAEPTTGLAMAPSQHPQCQLGPTGQLPIPTAANCSCNC